MNKFVLKLRQKLCSLTKKQRIAYSLLSLLTILFLISITYVIHFFTNTSQNYAVYDDIQHSEDIIVSSDEESSEEEALNVDFDSLWQINTDIYAYIYIPGTNISYPIVQSDTDNSYYLNHTIEGASGYPGSIYTESYNTKRFIDRNTLIYGHNMSNGTMFAHLYDYSDSDFFAQYSYIYIITPEKQLKYKIFASCMFDDRHITTSYDFSSMSGLEQYISDIKSISEDLIYDDSISLDTTSQILTLSTCMPTNLPDNRWLVLAVLEGDPD